MSHQQPSQKHKTIAKSAKNNKLAPMAKKQPSNGSEETKPKAQKKTTMQQLPTIQNMLQIPQEERAEKANSYFQKVKPFLSQFMQKKSGSRVLQLMFKWGGDFVKQTIYKCAQSRWKELIRSKFALYLLQKISRNFDFPGAVDDAVLLQSSWQGAKILEQSALKNQQNLKSIKDKFYQLWQKSKNGDIKSQQALHNLALKIIEKNYYNTAVSKVIIRLALKSMFAEQKGKIVEYLVGKVTQWVGDEEGVRLFIELINLCDPKSKKLLLRSFKGNIGQIITLNNPTYVAVIKLLTEVDDTVLVQKTLLDEVQALIPLIATSKYAFSIIFSLFSPRNHNFNILGKYEHVVNHTECKKPEELRKRELRASLYDPLINYLEGQALYQLLRHHVNNKLIVGVYKCLQEDNLHEKFNSFVSKVAKLFLGDAKDTLKLNSFAESLCADANANKIIKGILWLQDEVVDYYCDEFGKLVVKHIDSFLSTRAGFVLLGLIEKGGRDYLLGQVKKNKSKLKDSPVLKLLQDLLDKKTR